MNRIDRLTSIVIFLQGRKRTPVEKLSDKYGISHRTVYRDLSALQEAGVPIGSDPGKGYFIVQGYHLPPVMFSRDEATAFLAAERLMQKWSHTNLGKSYLSALEKIRSVLPETDKNYIELLDKHLMVYRWSEHGSLDDTEFDDDIFSFLQEAVVNRKVLRITYSRLSDQTDTVRTVEPLGLLLMSNRWYLAAWCRLRKDYRMFRLDRFKDYSTVGEILTYPAEHSLKEFHSRNLHKEKNLQEVVVHFTHQMLPFIRDQKYWHGWAWEQKTDHGIEMTFLCSNLEYLSRWLLIWGNDATIRKNDTVIKRVRELIQELQKHHINSSKINENTS